MPSYVFCEKLLAQTGALLTPAAYVCFELEGCARIGYACDGNELKAGLAAISSTLDTTSVDLPLLSHFMSFLFVFR